MKFNKIDFYCITHKNLTNFLQFSFIPFGVGENKYPKNFLTEKKGKNISKKNNNFGELTFHYWFWKNKLKNYKSNKWFGICHYRRFFILPDNRKKILKLGIQNFENKIVSINDLKKILLIKPLKIWNKYDAILCDPVKFNFTKFSKFFKKNKLNLLKDPFLFFKKKKHNLKLQFEMFHGAKFLNNAIKLLPVKEQILFINYLNSNNSLKANCMFISKNKKIINNLYENLFSWLFKCEKKFKNEELKNYGQKRIYVFLAERYIPFWLETYANTTSCPWVFSDINKLLKN